jgi:hypothetical protein
MADIVKHRILTSFFWLLSFLQVAVYAGAVSAQSPSLFPGISLLSESDIRNAAIAFVNSSTSPGLSGATITVDSDQRHSEQLRSSLGFSAEFTITNHIFNGYWGLAIVGGTLDDQINTIAGSGQPVKLDMKRKVLGLRGSIGLSFPMTQNFKLRPYLSFTASELETDTVIDGLTLTDPSGNPVSRSYFKTSAYMASTTGSVEALYSRWFDDNRLELGAQYNLIYTDSISEDNPVLDSIFWNQTVQLKGRYSGPTNLTTSGRSWRWDVYARHENYLDQNKSSLGYTGLFEVGTGLEWHMNMKPLNWFGWQTLGVSVGVITSRNVEGYSIGLTAR